MSVIKWSTGETDKEEREMFCWVALWRMKEINIHTCCFDVWLKKFIEDMFCFGNCWTLIWKIQKKFGCMRCIVKSQNKLSCWKNCWLKILFDARLVYPWCIPSSNTDRTWSLVLTPRGTELDSCSSYGREDLQ